MQAPYKENLFFSFSRMSTSESFLRYLHFVDPKYMDESFAKYCELQGHEPITVLELLDMANPRQRNESIPNYTPASPAYYQSSPDYSPQSNDSRNQPCTSRSQKPPPKRPRSRSRSRTQSSSRSHNSRSHGFRLPKRPRSRSQSCSSSRSQSSDRSACNSCYCKLSNESKKAGLVINKFYLK